MTMLKRINSIRRNVMRVLTQDIGTTPLNRGAASVLKTDIRRVLICRPNHRLGNLLLTTPLVQEVIAELPHADIELFVKGHAAPFIFANYPNIHHILQLPKRPFKDLGRYISGWFHIKRTRYDLVINVISSSSSGRLAVKFANGRFKFFGDRTPALTTYEGHEHNAKFPVYLFREALASLSIPTSSRPAPPMDIKLTDAELANGRTLLNDIVRNDKPTICLFTYATGDKRYSETWWDEFYIKLKEQHPEINIIEVLPVENVSQLSFKAPTFYSKDVREIGSLIANTKLFIGADSGMMHLASASLATTIGLFKITNVNAYTPYGNGSFAIDTNEKTIDECLTRVNEVVRASVLLQTS